MNNPIEGARRTAPDNRVSSSFGESREPSRKAIELAASLQTIHTAFKRNGGKLSFVQEMGFSGIGEGLMKGEQQGHVESFTGSGKSLYIALLAAAGYLAGQRVLIAADRKVNLDDLLGEDGETGLGKFVKGLLENKAVKEHYGGRRGNKRAPSLQRIWVSLMNTVREKKGNRERLENLILS